MKTGILAELEIQLYMSKLGVMVSIPYGDCARYDQIWDVDGKLLRIQIKTAKLLEDESGIIFSGRNTSGKYTKEQIDGIATFYNGKCYLVPADECSNEIKLRFTMPKNSQIETTKFAYDYEVNRILNIKQNEHGMDLY